MFAPIRKQQRVLISFLALADIITVPSALLLTWFLRTEPLRRFLPQFAHTLETYLRTIPALCAIMVISWWSAGMYSVSTQTSAFSGLTKRIRATVYLAVSIMAVSYLTKIDYSRIMVFIFILTSIPVNGFLRWAFRRTAGLASPCKEAPATLIIGSGEFAERVINSLGKLPEPRHRILGFSPRPRFPWEYLRHRCDRNRQRPSKAVQEPFHR